jgi:hypothetical protein
MDDPLRIIAAQHGVFLRREALDYGCTDKMLASLVRHGVLHRVRQGAYCFADAWATYSPEERHLVLARAVLRTTPGPVALSHTTALLAHGVAVWGADLRRVHVTRLDDGAGRLQPDVCHHVGWFDPDDIIEVNGLPVTTVDRAVMEAATILDLESGIVSADSALNTRLTDPDALHARFRAMNRWTGSQRIHVVLMWMDGRAESVGETRGRILFKRQGIPTPELQFEVYDERGTLVAVTDFVWHEHRAFGEFDGKLKYTRLARPGELPGDVVFREKRREDLVRHLTGYGCGRMTWDDLQRPHQTAAYFRTVLGLD